MLRPIGGPIGPHPTTIACICIQPSVSASWASPLAHAATVGLALLGQASAIYLMLPPKA